MDNAGARRGLVISLPFVVGAVGNIALVALRKVIPNNTKKLKKGDKVRCLLVRLRQFRHKGYGQFVKCVGGNYGVILKKQDEKMPLASRIFTKVGREAKLLGYTRIVSISKGGL